MVRHPRPGLRRLGQLVRVPVRRARHQGQERHRRSTPPTGSHVPPNGRGFVVFRANMPEPKTNAGLPEPADDGLTQTARPTTRTGPPPGGPVRVPDNRTGAVEPAPLSARACPRAGWMPSTSARPRKEARRAAEILALALRRSIRPRRCRFSRGRWRTSPPSSRPAAARRALRGSSAPEDERRPDEQRQPKPRRQRRQVERVGEHRRVGEHGDHRHLDGDSRRAAAGWRRARRRRRSAGSSATRGRRRPGP